MNKEFVPYSESVELKELGFDEKCLAYHRDNELYQEAGVCYVNSDFEPTMVWDEMLPNKNCTAPLFQQAFRWFREKYGDFLRYDWGEVPHFLMIQIEMTKGKTYEEAELACLRKLIESVK